MPIEDNRFSERLLRRMSNAERTPVAGAINETAAISKSKHTNALMVVFAWLAAHRSRKVVCCFS